MLEGVLSRIFPLFLNDGFQHSLNSLQQKTHQHHTMLYAGRASVVSPDDVIHRLLDHLEETKRLFAEERLHLEEKANHVIDIMHDCEQLTRNQIQLLHRALRRLK